MFGLVINLQQSSSWQDADPRGEWRTGHKMELKSKTLLLVLALFPVWCGCFKVQGESVVDAVQVYDR